MGVNIEQLDVLIHEYGERFFALTAENAPSFFSRERWVGVFMDWIISREPLKAEVFALIETLPSLTTERLLADHISRAFLRPEVLPPVLRFCLRIANLLGPVGRKLTSLIVRKCVKAVALQFIVASDIERTVARLAKMRKSEGFAFTVHVLGEETRTEQQLARYVDTYLQLLAALKTAQQKFKPLAPKKRGQEPFLISSGEKGSGAFSTLGDSDSKLDWNSSPRVNISVKPSALDARPDPEDLEGTVARMLERIRPVYEAVMESGGFLCIDAETLKLREITLELYRRLRSDPQFRHYPNLGLAIQTYFTDADVQIDKMLNWARQQNLPIAIRLVKGAYWDSEVALAQQAGLPAPVYTTKAETDIAFERAAGTLLQNHDICQSAFASHNIRSVCSALAQARELNAPEDRYEFQVLYGMARPFRNALLEMTGRVRLYCPHGRLLTGMAYLVRRILENTSNESFIRLTLAPDADHAELLENPQRTLERIKARQS